MNRTLPAGDRSHRSADPGWASRLAGLVPGTRGLERGTTSHPPGRPKIAAGASQLAHVRPADGGWQCWAMAERYAHVGTEIRSYRKVKPAGDNTLARGIGIATGAPELARVRALGATATSWPTMLGWHGVAKSEEVGASPEAPTPNGQPILLTRPPLAAAVAHLRLCAPARNKIAYYWRPIIATSTPARRSGEAGSSQSKKARRGAKPGGRSGAGDAT